MIKPTFQQAYFRFESGTTIPDHIDAPPTVPGYIGCWAIFGWIGSGTINYAVDIKDEELALLLAEAKKNYMEETLPRFKYSTDIYILSPEGKNRRYYMGRSIDNDY